MLGRKSESRESPKVGKNWRTLILMHFTFGLSDFPDFLTKKTIFAYDKIHDGLWNRQFRLG